MAHAGEVKALIIAPAWVGDMVMAHTLVQLLARENACQIDMLAPDASAQLATRMAEVTDVVHAPFTHGKLGISDRRRLGVELRERRYDVAFILPNSWKSALVPWFARIPRRVGWLGEARYGLLNDRRPLDKDAYPLMIERFMALAHRDRHLPDKPYPLPTLTADPTRASALCAKLDLEPTAVVGFAPGAEYGPAKKWPAAHYASLATSLVAAGKQVWLFGSPNDVEDCEAIRAQCPAAINLAGKTTLLDALDLLSITELVVCNDSGLMHVACALGLPTVGIYGSTSAAFTPPLGALAKTVEIELECRPCFERTCPLGHLNCLNRLRPEQVLDKIRT